MKVPRERLRLAQLITFNFPVITLLIATPQGKRILVTGGTGMIGSHLIQLLLEHDNDVVTVFHRRESPRGINLSKARRVLGDLTHYEDCVKATKDADYVFHLAAFLGGNGLMSTHPASVMTPNLIMNSNILTAAVENGVERFLFASSNTLYPNVNEVLDERMGLDGTPPEVHATFSWMKRVSEVQARAYHQEYGLKVAIVRPSNAYGPGDSFEIETSHAIPALIRKATERRNPYVVWGSGKSSRDFIHARDVARGMAMAIENYAVADPLNLASGKCTTIDELVAMIIDIVGFKEANVVHDMSRPEGQFMRAISTQKAKDKIGFATQIGLRQGLEDTIKWYTAE